MNATELNEKRRYEKWHIDAKKCQDESLNGPSKKEQESITKIASILREAASLFNLDESQGIIRAQKEQIEGLNRYVYRLTQKIKDLEIDA